MSLRVAIPNKGRLADSTLDLLQRAGVRVDPGSERRLFAPALDGRVTLLFVRAQDIPEFIQDGVADVGITGHDLVVESGKNVSELLDLDIGSCRLSLAAPEASPVRSAKEVPRGSKVATCFPRTTRAFFERLGNGVTVVEVSGATEVTPHIGVADYVVDLVSSGSTLKVNHLREVETLLTSSARVIVADATRADVPRMAEIEDLLFALRTVLSARGKRYLMANVPRARLDDVRRILPGLTGPTIMEIAGHPETVAAHAVVDEPHLYDTVNRLKALGATGILVLPIERLV
ncbi:MAG TPA: ATP phosphoribosyltransferase [Candidatus Thermoplasmatota archaeon]|nr:ATP phosphoribosyltransferase [Candidatus Thermoplasmatota archaeon]